MPCNGGGSLQHTHTDCKFTPSLEIINTNLKSHKFPVHQAEETARYQITIVLSSIIHSLESRSSSEITTQSTEGKKASVLKDTNNNNDAPSNIRSFNIKMNYWSA